MEDSKLKATSQNSKLDLKKRAYDLSIRVIKFATTLQRNDTSRIISNQLIRSVTSVGANIVEGHSSGSRKEFINYYQIALKSANESKYWLCLVRDAGLLKPDSRKQIGSLLNEMIEVSNMLAASLLTLKGKR